MRKLIAPLLSLLLAVCAGCAAAPAHTDGRLRVVATLFPQYDFACAIAGEHADVTLLLPPGAESHTFDPKPADIAGIYGADLFLYTGAELEPWAERLLASAPHTLAVTDVSAGVPLLEEEEHEPHAGHEEHERDPHFWLDPTLASLMADNIAAGLAQKDAGHAEVFQKNADAIKQKLAALDASFEKVVKEAKRDTLVFGGRFAYIYFLERYHLRYVSAYDGCSAQTEPGMKRVAEIIDFMRQNDIPCIYHEELAEPKIAEAIAKETGAKALLFSTAHNVARDQLEAGVTYFDIMNANLEAVKAGLNEWR